MKVRDFQSDASRQGAMFDHQARYVLSMHGWDVDAAPTKIPEAGVSVDAIGTHPMRGRAFFEFKGSWAGERPGMRRHDTALKAIACGALLSIACPGIPYIVVTSHGIESHGTGLDVRVRLAVAAGFIADVICINNPDDLRRIA